MNKKALIIDDSEINRLTIKTYLRQIGFYTDESEDGFKALKTLKDNTNYNVIFTDLEMPNMNGFEFIKRAKANELYKKIPIIVLSSLADEETINKVLSLGASAHISKPYNREKMKMALDKIVI